MHPEYEDQVESLKGYDLIEASDDVIKLLNGLKELMFKMHDVQYGYWTICQTMRKVLLTRRQQDNEPLAEYYKRFTSCVDVTESQWGP
jgi:DNA-directed RNA polymerase alpha subunit